MGEFDFFFSLFGLLLGLIIAEVATKFADAIGSHHRVPLGALTPMLAVFVLMDVASFWLWSWSARRLIHMDWHNVYGGLFIALSYFMAAALLFPRAESDIASLDDHFWAHRKFVVGGVILANIPPVALRLSQRLPALNDVWFFYWQAAYWVPMISLLFVRSRKVAIVLLSLMISQYLVNASDILPGSQWGDAIGLNGDAHMPASTRALAAPK